jgi:hypothetical protein
MCEARAALEDLLNHITEVARADPFKHDLCVALLSTLLAQLMGTIPVHFQATGLPGSCFYGLGGLMPSKPDSLKNVGFSSAKSGTTQRRPVSSEDFDWRSSKQWSELQHRYGSNISMSDVLDLIKQVGEKCGLVMDRESKRRKVDLIKWLHEHWEMILPHLPAKLPSKNGLDVIFSGIS